MSSINTIMNIFKCNFCSKEWNTSRSFNNHILRCKLNIDRDVKLLGSGRPVIRPTKLVGPPSPTNCEFCNKFYPYGTSTPAFNNHVKRCPKNPNKFRENLTPAGKQKMLDALSNSNARWNNPEIREKHSLKMRDVASKNPDSYSQRNINRAKKIIYNDIHFDSSWEVDFYKWCEKNNITCNRNTIGFQYEYNGSRTYYPDFYLPTYNVYVEVKGQETEKDIAKWRNFPEKLLKIKKKEIDLIKKDMYNLYIDF